LAITHLHSLFERLGDDDSDVDCMRAVRIEFVGPVDECPQIQEDALEVFPGERDALGRQPVEILRHRVPM
jgi:hypothetical protein